MQLYLDNANLDLLSILKKFSKFNLKKSEIRINQLKIQIYPKSNEKIYLYGEEENPGFNFMSNIHFYTLKYIKLNQGFELLYDSPDLGEILIFAKNLTISA